MASPVPQRPIGSTLHTAILPIESCGTYRQQCSKAAIDNTTDVLTVEKSEVPFLAIGYQVVATTDPVNPSGKPVAVVHMTGLCTSLTAGLGLNIAIALLTHTVVHGKKYLEYLTGEEKAQLNPDVGPYLITSLPDDTPLHINCNDLLEANTPLLSQAKATLGVVVSSRGIQRYYGELNTTLLHVNRPHIVAATYAEALRTAVATYNIIR